MARGSAHGARRARSCSSRTTAGSSSASRPGVLELEFGRSKHYAMGYSAYRREKAMALANQADAFERQQAEIERLQRFVDKFRAGTRSRQAQSKVKAIQRMPRVEAPRRDRAIAFGFSKVERSGRIVVEAEHADAARRRQAAARRRRARGRARPARGRDRPERRRQDDARRDAARPARRRSAAASSSGHNVTTGYFSQHIAEMPEHLSVVDAMTRATGGHLNSTQSRTILGNFLFTQEEVDRKVGVLSGGERRRLALAALVAGGANLLVLDEPTNHLDVEAREALEEALDAYEGTVAPGLARSRADRRGCDAHGEHRESAHRAAPRRLQRLPRGDRRAPGAPAPPPRPAPRPRRRARPRTAPGAREAPALAAHAAADARSRSRASRSSRAEQATLEATLADPANAGDHDRLSELGTRYQQVQEELAWKLLEWERVQAGDGLEV